MNIGKLAKRLRKSIIGESRDKSGAKMEPVKGGNLEDDAHMMDLYSRQIGAYGVEAMSKLVKMRVLVIGLNGVGIEVAKNLILAGPGAVTLVDDEVVALKDLGTNFYLRKEHVGKTSRAEACLPSLKSLNGLVNVSVHQGPLTPKLVAQYTVVADCGLSNEDAIKWNAYCRKTKAKDSINSIGYIRSINYGLTGFAFTDLGNKFQVRDLTGEPPISRIIEKIELVNDGKTGELRVFVLPPPDGRMHNLEESKHEGWVTFEEVDGELGELLNGKGSFPIKHTKKKNSTGKMVFDAYSFTIQMPDKVKLPNTTATGGSFTQAKAPIDMGFRSLAENLEQPIDKDEGMLMFTDGAKFGRAEQLHVALCALWDYEKKHGCLPPANDVSGAAEVLDFAKKRNAEMKDKADAFSVEELDEDIVKAVARFADCTFQPMSCFFGGVVAQEVVKLTGKFTPLHQWVTIDCLEVLPEMFVDTEHEDYEEITDEDRKPIGSRYDDLIQIIGLPLHRKLLKSKTFMVGCGALGCELLKNFALLGVACDEGGAGLVSVTDNDTIEVSNLSRQFLFREENVGQSKAIAATNAAMQMNPAFTVKAHEILVEPRTETTFNDAFWESLDFVTNALDNVKARVYVDDKCVFYEKPLLESGTLGTKCNAQVILPHKTASYSDGPMDNDGEDNIPMCTLRNFPSEIEHCIEWARAQFTDLFTSDATKAQNFLEDPKEWLAELRKNTLDLTQGSVISAVTQELESLKAVHKLLMQGSSGSVTFEECVKIAFELFHIKYRDAIDALIKLYPEDHTDKEGNLFWSGTKRFPQSALFDVKDEKHMQYVISMANILAYNFGLQPANVPVPADDNRRDPAYVGKIISGLEVPPPAKQKVDMSGGGEDDAVATAKDTEEDSAMMEEFESLLSDLVKLSGDAAALKKITVEPADFEKDDDTNFHIDFITAASNLRAWNYRLKEVSRHKCKMIAGKIIPAIATTTAAVTGLVCMELLKLLQPGKKIEAFKDSSNSLGINAYFFSEPPEPRKAKDEFDVIELCDIVCKPQGFTKWDKTLIEGDLTVQEFLDQYREKTGLNCVNLTHASSTKPGVNGTIYEADAYGETERKVYGERLGKNMKSLIKELYGEKVLPDSRTYIALETSTRNDEEEAFKVPQVVYRFK